ncbi:MAG: hypothetical protein FWD64_02220 [Acidobacteriaceae bacterium]|nr:hypothetical protein [Acidobacteriaceae bacterium]
MEFTQENFDSLQNQNASLQAENETLRRTNAALVERKNHHKQRAVDAEAKHKTASDALYQLQISAPLRGMAERLSTVPELWLEQFAKAYRVESHDGKLVIVNAPDGKESGFDFTEDAIKTALLDSKHPMSKTFCAITIVSRASGGSGSPIVPSTHKPASAKRPRSTGGW